jgi:hypothetical protein
MEVHGRGELQMGILLETMRRELYEVSVSPPQVHTSFSHIYALYALDMIPLYIPVVTLSLIL